MLKKYGSCHGVIRLASKGLETKLTFLESLALGFHKMMCSACRGYTKEIKQLADLAKEKQMDISGVLDETRKNRIKEAVEKLIAEDE